MAQTDFSDLFSDDNIALGAALNEIEANLGTLETAVEAVETAIAATEAAVEAQKDVALVSAVINDWTAVAQNTIAKSAEYDMSAAFEALLHIQAALDTTTAHTGTKFIIQVSAAESGDEDWNDYAEFTALIGTAATDAIEDDPLAAGATEITLTGHALTTEGVWLFIEDGTLINSEMVFESASDTNDITLLDGTKNAHLKAVALFNLAMVKTISLPASVGRVRLVIDNSVSAAGSTLNYKLGITKVATIG